MSSLRSRKISDDFSTALEKYSMYQIKSNHADEAACKAHSAMDL